MVRSCRKFPMQCVLGPARPHAEARPRLAVDQRPSGFDVPAKIGGEKLVPASVPTSTEKSIQEIHAQAERVNPVLMWGGSRTSNWHTVASFARRSTVGAWNHRRRDVWHYLRIRVRNGLRGVVRNLLSSIRQRLRWGGGNYRINLRAGGDRRRNGDGVRRGALLLLRRSAFLRWVTLILHC